MVWKLWQSIYLETRFCDRYTDYIIEPQNQIPIEWIPQAPVWKPLILAIWHNWKANCYVLYHPNIDWQSYRFDFGYDLYVYSELTDFAFSLSPADYAI